MSSDIVKLELFKITLFELDRIIKQCGWYGEYSISVLVNEKEISIDSYDIETIKRCKKFILNYNNNDGFVMMVKNKFCNDEIIHCLICDTNDVMKVSFNYLLNQI